MNLTVAEAQAQLPEVIHRLQAGEEVVITEGDQIVAKIVGDRGPLRQRPEPGLGRGMITINAEDDEHLKEFEEYLP